MTKAAPNDPDAPIWAREDAFPKSPAGWGWADIKGRTHACDSPEALISAIREDREGGVALAWTPQHAHMVLPEELPEASDAVIAARRVRTKDDLLDSQGKLQWFGWLLAGVAALGLYQGWTHAPAAMPVAGRLIFAIRTTLSSISIGLAMLMVLIFAFIPWYQARKRFRELRHWNSGDISTIVPTLRFETWLDFQKAPVTRLFLVIIGAVGLVQLLPGDSVSAAGLVKDRYLHHGEWWRLFTAPMLHGNIVHFLMNAAALAYLGKRLEVFARWPHLPLVFVFAACVGGEASARFAPQATSIGASGGLIGWLGFLLVFESLHSRLVPRSATRRLLAGVLLTALIGLIGYRFIDNAAHAGGLVAGMAYAAIVFPKSSSPVRPRSTITDRIGGVIALVIVFGSALFAVLKILGA